MSSYEKRKEELTKTLALIKPAIPEEESKKLEEAIKQYCEARDEALNRMFMISTDTGDNKRESDWKDQLGRGRDALKGKLENTLSSIREPSKAGLEFVQAKALDEHRFWTSLEKLNIGVRRDDLMMLSQNLEWEIAILAKKWETTEVENKPLLEQERQATDMIKAMVNKTIVETAPMILGIGKNVVAVGAEVKDALRVTKEIVAAQINKYTGINEEYIKGVLELGLPTLRKLLEDRANKIVKEMIKAVEEYIKTNRDNVQHLIEKRKEDYNDKIRRQTDGIFVVFRQTRRETDEFIKKNGYDVAKKQYEEARNDLKSWCNELPTDGLKEDGKHFAEELGVGLNLQLIKMEKMFNRFVQENEGRFFGPVGPHIEEALAQTRLWDDELRTLDSMGRDLEEKLRQWRSDAHQFLEFDLKNAFQFDFQMQDLPEEFQREVRTYVAAFGDEVLREAKALIEQIDRLEDEMKRLAGAGKMLEALSRRPLDSVRQ